MRLGAMLARLQTLPGAQEKVTRKAGAWHHLAGGLPGEEIAAAAALLAADGLVAAGGRPAYETLCAEVAGIRQRADVIAARAREAFRNPFPGLAVSSGAISPRTTQLST